MRKALSVIMALALGCVCAMAQNVSINAVNRPAAEVFAEIMRQTGLNFVYDPVLLKGLRVSVKANEQSIDSSLGQMFAGTDIRFSRRGNNIILKRAKAPKAKEYTLSGFVREAGSGEVMIGAVVADASSGRATVTNSAGFYSLKLPEGSMRVEVSYLGFEPYNSPAISLNANHTLDISLTPYDNLLNEVTVVANKNRKMAIEDAGVGLVNLSRQAIEATPVIFGESDVVKALQLEPGVSAGVEGMAGMYVHGGASHENLYMLDNIPLYQVNHFGGLFSAFNTDAIRSVDFYKTSFPAKYDGRLASFMDVHTRDGSLESHHGSFKLGLTSGALSLNGPIWKGHTTYSLSLRRSWYDVLTIPGLAIVNSASDSEKTRLGYAFTDLNAKITHHFSDRSQVYGMFYFGEDYLKVGAEDKPQGNHYWWTDETNKMRWGNLVASIGWKYQFTDNLFGQLTGAYSRYKSSLRHEESEANIIDGEKSGETFELLHTDNNIHDWILRADLDWHPHNDHTVTYGASYTRHSFLPSKSRRVLQADEMNTVLLDSAPSYKANELSLYIGDDWAISRKLRANFGVHYSVFDIDGKSHGHLSPRASLRYRPTSNVALKAAYSRTAQFVHQLNQSAISLPTDQWVPIVADQKPQTADKVAAGVYYSLHNRYTFSVEAYYKWMHNLLDFSDEYYLLPPEVSWDSKLTAGKGTAKGLDFKVTRDYGKVTGHISYSLMWADRQFDNKNHGKPFPARYDNRHKINALVNWKVNDKWEINASWTGMSGNRFTLPTQVWTDPELGPWHYDMMLETEINNYRMPFYHRLDLSFTRHTKNGFWNFSFYNAYCNMNVIAVRLDYNINDATEENGYRGRPVFQKIRLIPIIPSVSYTWLF